MTDQSKPDAPPRYRAQVNDCQNNAIYAFRVYDAKHDRFIAFCVTQHTAESWVKQLNEVGYVETI